MVKSDLANMITFSRIVGVVFIFWLMPFMTEEMQLLTIVLYTVVSLTDFLDGWIARRFNIVSELGKVLDPLADKLLVLVFLPLLTMNAISAFPVFIVLAREFAIMGLRVFAAKHGDIIAANFSGKLKTGITLPVCGILMARPPVIEMEQVSSILMPLVLLRRWVFNWPNIVYDGLIWLMVFVTIVSFLDYFFRFMWVRQLRLSHQDRLKAKRALYAYIPNTISFFNMMCGVLSAWSSIKGNLLFASGFILVGMILDGLDGRIARRLETHSKLGEKIDSKADYTTFGIAPSVLLFAYFSQFHNFFMILAWGVGGLYFLSVWYRLRRFSQSGHGDSFEGLPSPVGAGFLCAVMASSFLSGNPYIVLVCSICMVVLMVSKVPYPHNQAAHKKLFFKHLRAPVLFFIGLVILKCFGGAFLSSFYVSNILFGLTLIYLLAPVLPSVQE